MSNWHLSRISLKRDVPASALAPVLLPAAPDARVAVAHRLLWTLFADAPEQRRDFLWRESGRRSAAAIRQSFLLLSPRPPVDRHGLFELETKPFEPRLQAGDRLAYSLRANPVVSRKADSERRGRRHDVVMDRLRELPAGQRAAERHEAAEHAGRAWLAAQGIRHGFELDAPPRVDGYDQVRIERGRDRRPVLFSVLDLEGRLTVKEPEAFLAALQRGFGKAKAFGCGLMLIRRD